MDRMTDAEVMAELRSDTPLNRARAAFSGAYGTIEQAAQQRRPPGPIEIRRMEFEAVLAIAAALRGDVGNLPVGYELSERYGDHMIGTRQGRYHVFDAKGMRHGISWETPEQARRLVDVRVGTISWDEFGRLEAEDDARMEAASKVT